MADEARPLVFTNDGETRLSPHALSGDGRFVVFDSERTLVADDTNGAADVFLRDRHTGVLTRISVASNGVDARNGPGRFASDLS